MTYAKDGSKRIGSWTKVSNLSQKFQRMTFLLQWIGFRISGSKQFNRLGLDLHLLALPHRLHQGSSDSDCRACSYLFQQLLVKISHLNHNLDVVNH